MIFSNIRKRWLIYSIAIALIFAIIITFTCTILIKNHYYKSIKHLLDSNVNSVSSYFASSSEFSSDFNSTAYSYARNFQNKDKIELTLFDRNGKPIVNSKGFSLDDISSTPDCAMAKESSTGYAMFLGKVNQYEKIMAVSQIIKNSNEELIGSVRYVTSLEDVDKHIILWSIFIFSSSLLFAAIFIITTFYFNLNSMRPIREIVNTAKLIAHGNFKVRISQNCNGEMLQLCEAVNYMVEELENLENIKNEFISSVSHELRTPLTAIRGWAETMKLSGFMDSKTMDKGMQIIINETERLSDIVEELLDFSHIQNQTLKLMLEKTDILAELDEVVCVYREKAISEGKYLIFDIPETIPPILADKKKMRQVFINVIDNALKYSEEGQSVNIVAKQQNADIIIAVSDRGPGINENDLPRVKEKFFKANTTKRGSGIGLAVSDEIMLAHSGRLDIESKEGVGTTVYIVLPLLEAEDSKELEENIQDLSTEINV